MWTREEIRDAALILLCIPACYYGIIGVTLLLIRLGF
jgi:hypothetical protein